MWAQGNQWNPMSMDAAAYQNMSHESVDWASLAQQWIQMKEVNETGVAPLTVQQVYHETHSFLPDSGSGVIGGEAEMDVEKDDEALDANVQDWSVHQPQSFPNSWPQQPQAIAPRLGFPHIHHPIVHSAQGLPVIPGFHQNVHHPTSSLPIAHGFPQSFRTISPAVNSSFPRVPLLTVQPKQGSSDEDSLGPTSSFGALQSLDATKRKNLPAWIREGLEKMEREKQKKEEREKFLQEREIQRQKEIESSNQIIENPNVVKSRFDDSEDEDSEEQDDEAETASTLPASSMAPKTRETLQDIMIIIRQLMTEVLLEVTTEEIREAANEAMLFFKGKSYSLKNQQVQSSLSSKSLTRKLGLDQYGSGSESDDDAGEQIELQQASGSDDSTGIDGHDKPRRSTEEKFERNSHQTSQEMVDKTKRWEKKVLKSGDSRQSSNEKCVKISETVGKVNHGFRELAAGTVDPKMKIESAEKKSGSESLDISKSKSSDTHSHKHRRSKSPDIRRRSRSRDRHSSNSGRSNRNHRRSRSRRSRSHSRDSKRSSKRSRSRSGERKYTESKRKSTSPYRRKSGHGKKRDNSRERRKSRSRSRDRKR